MKKINSGVKLWRRAKKIIPGGNQLLSKRAEMFLPEQWPAYYKKAKGVEVWDLNNNHYIDMSILGIGTCVLGYANPEVNRAVKKAIKAGTMCTLNCYEEVELAEKLIELHPWADMARFARTGGEACAIAIRISRAATGKDKVAFCGYHGWHDWYLSANLIDAKSLNGHLLPGLEPAGVPRMLKGSSFPFNYGNLDELEKIVAENRNDIGVIVMEVERHKKLDIEFLKGVRRIARRIGAVLIFDEVTSGFRMSAGGMHTLYDIEPDIVVLGKAMGNGYPIAAIVGRREVMKAAQDTFISSTYWTERIGFVAALEVIRQFEKNNVAEHLITIGNYIKRGLERIFNSQKLKIEIVGLPPAPIIVIKEEKPLVIKTVFTQEMLKRGFLASTLIYVSYAHTEKIVNHYLEVANEVFGKIVLALRDGQLENMLEGPVCHSGFRRLT